MLLYIYVDDSMHSKTTLITAKESDNEVEERGYCDGNRSDAESDDEVSDIEEQGYCDVSRSDPELRMRVKSVRSKKVEALYNNTDVVSIIIEILLL